MISLPNVTLVAMTGKNTKEHLEALKKSSLEIKWGQILLLTSETDSEKSVVWDADRPDIMILERKIEPITSIDDWNKKIIYELPRYISTTHALLIHADGYVIHPDLWDDHWLNYDYIGAPWPLPLDDYSYRDEAGNIVRVGNSVSLRSKRLMDLVATREWKEYHGNTNEDGFICCHNRFWLTENEGCKFAPLSVAIHFSKEHEIPENMGLETFAFHSL